jgi:hypothetical protein
MSEMADNHVDDSHVSVLVEIGNGEVCEFEGPVNSQVLKGFEVSHVRLSSDILSARGVGGDVPAVKVEELQPEPLFFEGFLDSDSKMKLWGLDPRWGWLFKIVVHFIAVLFDIMTVFFSEKKSRVIYARAYRMLAFVFWLLIPACAWGLGEMGIRVAKIFPSVVPMFGVLQYAVPMCLFLGAWVMLVASIRQQNGRSFMESLRAFYAPIPAFEQGPVFSIGHLLLSLKDTHTNMISFGGIGSGKCWARGTRMLMYDGTVKSVESIKVGDLLMGPDSKPRRILSTTKGRSPMYWISERGVPKSQGWGCNDVHMLTLKHVEGRPKVRWRMLAKDRRSAVGGKKMPWYKGLYEVSGLRSFGLNERTGMPVRPQDVAEVELKGFLERTSEENRKGFNISKVWKMFRVPVDFEISEVSKRVRVSDYYDLGHAVARELAGGLSPTWDSDVYLRSSRRKRMSFLSGFLDCSSVYGRGGYEFSLDGPWKRHLLLLIRSLGFVALDVEGGIVIKAGSRCLGELGVRKVSKGRIESGNGRDPLMYDWQVEAQGEGDYYGFTVDGDGRLLLEDCTVTHNTAGFVNPTLLQFFRKLNSSDPFSVYARWGGLVLDVKGDFIDFVLYCFKLVGRPLVDLVIIDPDLDLVRYNPLDSSDRLKFSMNGAAKLAAVQKIIGGGGGDAKDRYWDDTSKAVIASALQVLQVMRNTASISLADVGRYMRDDDMVDALLKEAAARLMRDRYKIVEEEYFGYKDAIDKLRTEWVGLSENTKSILKTTISGMLGTIVGSASLQKVFCRETNFSFQQVITEGKVVLFRGTRLDDATSQLLAVCLKLDFQTWAKRRNGSTKAQFGLAKEGCDRTLLFVCDEYQNFVTAGKGGDEDFYGVSRSCLVCAIVATQHYTSLLNALGGNDNQVSTLTANLCTKVFLNSPDPKTGELGESLGARHEQEKLRESVSDGRVLGKGDGGGGSTQVDKDIKENFRKDRFANLLTIDMQKSRDGPWYSEGFVYHYNSWEKGPSKMFETRLMHCYAPRDYMARVSVGYDVLLRDRNAQRLIANAALGLQAHASVIREERFKELAGNKAKADMDLHESAKTLTMPDGVPLSFAERSADLEARIEEQKARLARASGREAEQGAAYLRTLETRLTELTLGSLIKPASRTECEEFKLCELLGGAGSSSGTEASPSSSPSLDGVSDADAEHVPVPVGAAEELSSSDAEKLRNSLGLPDSLSFGGEDAGYEDEVSSGAGSTEVPYADMEGGASEEQASAAGEYDGSSEGVDDSGSLEDGSEGGSESGADVRAEGFPDDLDDDGDDDSPKAHLSPDELAAYSEMAGDLFSDMKATMAELGILEEGHDSMDEVNEEDEDNKEEHLP